MTDRSTQSIVINASPEAIMDVIADFASYPPVGGGEESRGDDSRRWWSDGASPVHDGRRPA